MMHPGKVVFRVFLILFFLFFVVTPAILLIFGLQSNPLVIPGKKLTFEDVARVKKLLRENNPRRLQAGEIKSVSVNERDLNLLFDYAFSRAPMNQKLYARVDLYKNAAYGRFTFTLPDNPIGNYLNISAYVHQSSRNITVGKLKIGALTLPGWLLNPVARFGHKYLQRYQPYQEVFEVVQSVEDVQINKGNMRLTYQWNPDAIKQLRARGKSMLIDEDEKNRLYAYNERLAMISNRVAGRNVSLTKFISPMFQFARERTIAGQNPTEENRTLLLTLAAYSVGRNLNSMVGDQNVESHPRPRHVNLTLLGRGDLAKHFLISSALTVSGGSGLANLLGIFKEMDDSRGGSGFSFADLAADQAGVKLAEIAVGSSRQAKLLQQRMSTVINETEYMPHIDHLPEGIMELEFKRRYHDLDSKTYQMVEREIERRLTGCRVYQ